MEDKKNKYPGFINGLKASNITLNKTSIDEYAEQILSRVKVLIYENKLPPLIIAHLKRGEQSLRKSLDKQLSPEEVIQFYIKFGDILLTITPDLKEQYYSEIKDIVINYLQIAKYSLDSRIKDLSISIAKAFE